VIRSPGLWLAKYSSSKCSVRTKRPWSSPFRKKRAGSVSGVMQPMRRATS